MGAAVCKEELKEEKTSAGKEDSLTSTDRIRRFAVRQFGYSVLSLARRGMKEVPDELWELLELQKLNLSLNRLKVVPPQLALLSNLVVLNLWGNQLSSLPAEIGHLTRLRVLFAYRNKLTEVPEELGACTQLEVLHTAAKDLRHGSVASSFIDDLWLTTVLSLANNQLCSLPASLSNLSRLRKLNLSHNHIAHVPSCIYDMRALVHSHQAKYGSWALECYWPSCFPDIPALFTAGYLHQVFLHLAWNCLENLAENIQALAELKILIVEGNSLHTLPKALCTLTRLELLNLDFNDIKDVPQDMHHLSRLEKLAHHPLDKGLHIVHNPLLKPVKEVLEGGLTALYNYLRAGGGAS
ncbi:leucine-rich repeat-containing protein 30-like isoform X1 [Mastacembelus armatus]|uniref:leucine-rich repeat-containing protein 30-like isoform X1 n=1 Tax=Mastacembelus armatus TaxID=205130 RepID=UPI000E461145|nr:leucine-rich repeat-containing protein 30-like isoform X1 [Mastacembelus armatus]XP_033181674.1 leucine-rich repeat-containing protein 30-like isoform X1 [Mastacembelus armatus]XP_033181675.1 leucine-rich repeat-containing protein 30-like isoform X1 [Mastacembelus armatus]